MVVFPPLNPVVPKFWPNVSKCGTWFSTFDLVKHMYSFIHYLIWDQLYNGSDFIFF